nr:hypothetical protein [uncultured Rhodopila sp.]
MLRASLAVLSLLAALPAAAQDRGGMHMNNAITELGEIQANQGCPLSATSVTVGVNTARGGGSSATQQLGTQGGGSSGCRPLVSTRVVTGANLALGSGSYAGQSITAQGPSGVLATNTYTRGYNAGYGALSTANQRLLNGTGH